MATTEFDVSQLRSPLRERLTATFGGALARISGTWRAMRNRHSVAQLLEWDSRMLKDIGLTATDVRSALSTPLLEDSSYRLSLLSVERRIAARAAAIERLAEPGTAKVIPIRRRQAGRVRTMEI